MYNNINIFGDNIFNLNICVGNLFLIGTNVKVSLSPSGFFSHCYESVHVAHFVRLMLRAACSPFRRSLAPSHWLLRSGFFFATCHALKIARSCIMWFSLRMCKLYAHYGVGACMSMCTLAPSSPVPAPAPAPVAIMTIVATTPWPFLAS